MPQPSDHHTAVAAAYAAYRPTYPTALVDALAAACARTELAWDVGCGSGQLSLDLAGRFARVIATDPSQAQLDHAPPHPAIEYRRAPAEASALPDACADLVVAAQAAHWFDWPRFVAEAGRVARPGAVVALVSYGRVELAGTAGAALAAYQAHVAAYWPPGREHVDNGYRDLVWPWPALPAPAIAMVATWTRDALFGYVTSWSATERRRAALGPGALDELADALTVAWPNAEPREIRWPLTLKLARMVERR